MRNLFKVLIVILCITLSSCSEKSEKTDKKILLHYNNEQIFCEGFYQVYKEKKKRKGIWKFYYSDGQLENLFEYDNDGDILNYKSYEENGKLLISQIGSKSGFTYLEFYENGNIKYEEIQNYDLLECEEENFETSSGTVKEYYLNGQLKSQKGIVDSEYDGKASQWDKNGNLLIEYEYSNGFIKEQ